MGGALHGQSVRELKEQTGAFSPMSRPAATARSARNLTLLIYAASRARARGVDESTMLAYMTFPGQHRTKLHSTNPLERLNKEVKRRADVVGIFPNEAAIIRLIGAVLLEQNDEWQLQHRYMQVEVMAELVTAPEPTDPRQIPCAA